MMLAAPASPVAKIGLGQVRHARLKPVEHRFAYPTCFLWLPMRALMQAHAQGDAAFQGLPLKKTGLYSFWPADHGQGSDPVAWLDGLLQRNGILDAHGELFLHTYPRTLGHTFKPVSFWHAHRADGSLRAAVVEVNNTFGERHCYLIDSPRLGHTHTADKVFHVSPFNSVAGHYEFRFMRTAGDTRTIARVDLFDDGPHIQTSISGDLQPMSADALNRAFWQHPLLTLAVIARIHWQALRLWTKRVPFFSKPAPPETFVTR